MVWSGYFGATNRIASCQNKCFPSRFHTALNEIDVFQTVSLELSFFFKICNAVWFHDLLTYSYGGFQKADFAIKWTWQQSRNIWEAEQGCWTGKLGLNHN